MTGKGHHGVLLFLVLGCTSTVEPTAPPDGYHFEVESDLLPQKVSITVDGIPSGGEDTRCIDVRLDTTDRTLVRRFIGKLTAGSHHLIVYRSTETVERPEPYVCSGFDGLLDGDHPIFIAQQDEATLTFPTDGGVPVALELDAAQMLRLELHYINTTAAPLSVTGTLELATMPPGRDVTHSDLAFWGTTRLNAGGTPPTEYLPAGGHGDTGLRYQRGIPDTKSFAATTHQHRLGTRMRIWHAPSEGLDTIEQQRLLVDGTDWEHPPLALLDPPIPFGENDEVLAYRCEYENTTTQDVYWGEDFHDEMCFLWHYYYPSQGAHLCIENVCAFSHVIDDF